ncbi:MAG: BatA domain-containing protein [Planctomycetes bacterium]|nr:BatA domain-containing protein [Planctomycetota bacterium]
MNVLAPTFLAALAAIAIPIVVHLIFRWQTRRVELGTIRFLAEILRETARRRRVKRWLLLALRTAAVALVAFLFARPYLLATEAGGERRLAVFLVDRSASMSLQRDRERIVDAARQKVEELLAGLPSNSDWELAFFDTAIHGTEQQGAIPAPPDRLYGATSYGTAIAWARDVCLKSPHARRDVYIFTDLQRSGLDWTTAGDFPADVLVHVEDLGRTDVSNAAVTSVAVAETLVAPGEMVPVRVTAFNHGPFPLGDIPVRVTLQQGQRTIRLEQTVSLPSHEAVEVEFEAGPLEAGLWQGIALLEVDDDLTFDNQRHLAVLAAAQQRVLIVDGSAEAGGLLPETFFLEKALRLAAGGETWSDSPFVPTRVAYAADGLPPLGEFDLVVLANLAGPNAGDARRLAEFVRAGGGLVIFTGENVTVQSAAALAEAGLVPGRIRGIARSNDLPFRWRRWEERHPSLEPFADPQHGDLRRLAFIAYTQFSPGAGSKVLAWFGEGEPALVESRMGDGRVMWFLSSLSPSWGDWTRSRLFLPIVHQMLGDLAGLTGGGPVRSAVLGQLPEESADSEAIERPGVNARGDHWLVVNLDPQESETDRLSVEEFARRFELTTPQGDGREVAAANPAAARLNLRADEVWHWVLCVIVGVMCLECFVANRTTA